ncbi:MAG: tRNA (adenosine(37)-N6)-dimethylallyltransferase MiaA [Bacteroidales bacterium]|nr:tRNA (adenosine(37)-N6)-dimethylallyltransferase MiaA [Bacteroidales bacterium]
MAEVKGSRIAAIVTGPTASGKTSLAIDLACHFGTEIVSADSRQIYKDLPIGTAAPTTEERSRAFHHLIGTMPLDAYYSAARFEEDALRILDGIWQQHDVAVVCGGSMMYVDALVKGFDDMPQVSDSTRAYVLSMLEQQGSDAVLAQLEIVDPDTFARIDRANMRRVVHALEISLEAGVPYSLLCRGQRRERPFKVLKFAIDRSREDLFDRINRRVDLMIEQGLEEEARRALATGDYNSLNTVGYKEMKAMFEGEMDRETAIARIAKNTRVYAKKQLTRLRRDPDIIWLNPATAFEDAVHLIEAERNK